MPYKKQLYLCNFVKNNNVKFMTSRQEELYDLQKDKMKQCKVSVW